VNQLEGRPRLASHTDRAGLVSLLLQTTAHLTPLQR
jgi:hypothetical protein